MEKNMSLKQVYLIGDKSRAIIGIEGYTIPRTRSQYEYFAPSLSNEKTFDKQKKAIQQKGNKFGKQKKMLYLNLIETNPAPNHYFKQKTNQPKAHVQQSKITKSISYKKNEQIPGVGQYNLQQHVHKIDFKGLTTLSKAQRTSFYEQSMRVGTLTPGPGQYIQPQYIPKKFRQSKKDSSLRKVIRSKSEYSSKMKKQLQLMRVHSYANSNLFSKGKSFLIKQPYKETDKAMKERLTKWSRANNKQNKLGPGKYIELVQWAQYKNQKKQQNCLTILSKLNNQRVYY